MKKIIFILLLVLSNDTFSQDIVLNKDTILIGEQVRMKITKKLDSINNWPIIDSVIFPEIEVLSYSKIDTNKNIISQEFVLTSFDEGTYNIPRYKIYNKNTYLNTSLVVKTITLTDKDTIKDIKKPISANLKKEKKGLKKWYFKTKKKLLNLVRYIKENLLFSISIIYLIILLFFIILYYLNKSDSKKYVPADIIALNKLKNLKAQKLLQKGKIKEFHSIISEIIRSYINIRFNYNALETTTKETINALKLKIDKKTIENLELILSRSDLAKYAKIEPRDIENQESFDLANKFINLTKEIRNDK